MIDVELVKALSDNCITGQTLAHIIMGMFIPVEDSLIDSVAYNVHENVLTVKFTSGDIRQYKVSVQQYIGLMTSPAKSEYFWQFIDLHNVG